MRELNRFLALLFLSACGFALSYLVFTNGWGLRVRSWGWLIGGAIVSPIFGHLVSLVIRGEKE